MIQIVCNIASLIYYNYLTCLAISSLVCYRVRTNRIDAKAPVIKIFLATQELRHVYCLTNDTTAVIHGDFLIHYQPTMNKLELANTG